MNDDDDTVMVLHQDIRKLDESMVRDALEKLRKHLDEAEYVSLEDGSIAKVFAG